MFWYDGLYFYNAKSTALQHNARSFGKTAMRSTTSTEHMACAGNFSFRLDKHLNISSSMLVFANLSIVIVALAGKSRARFNNTKINLSN